MLKLIFGLLLIVSLTPPALAKDSPVKVMVLGSYHFDNPGLDVNNMQADDVRTPVRQRQLEALAKALLTFRPTKVMVEQVVEDPSLIDPSYAAFKPEQLANSTNEIAQIGYRVARLAGLTTVYGIDEQPQEGEPDYFPYDVLQAEAKKRGQSAILDVANAEGKAWLSRIEAAQASHTIAELLVMDNDPNGLQGGMDYYYRVLPVGDTKSQPGADLNAMWYLRNAKIFGKLMHVARPGDRVLVLYGSGHNYWLRHFAHETPGFVSIDPIPFLKKAHK